ncbi:Gfo/Idh/MocA family oxidoreductase [Sabulilitoribacter multivorans]|uniref:Gfo/Idh/MocA family oxidoreductase n=1 Tax=Flaviramulus multivorans TaxID=1304750 RepID=A0ABS9IG06_9FLAO|nr:Gfo/Idh/MocA family oxidoreductase [Flaviramulus multivorans]MCF7559677.1 Gfo/Idh/MocA family oxidoreductase [Flaviramulus multivorans]
MKISRRTFNTKLAGGLLGVSLLSKSALAYNFDKKNQRKLGVALVGLGGYSKWQLAPALLDTKYCYLAGIVTGTPSKGKEWMRTYNIPKENVYNYDNFDEIAKNSAIDIVYVVLPNSMHADFSIRAAKAGKHVICEKPMAVSVAECDAIINACNKAGVKLSVGYRMQSDPYTNEVKRLVKEKPFGTVQYVSSDAGYYSGGNPNQWRLNKKLSGGGALVNMGVYAIQSNIYGTGTNPISVSAQEFSTRPEYFKDTDETITAQMQFPNGAVGNLFTSHNANANRLFVSFKSGWVELNPCHSYGPLAGRTSEGRGISFPHRSQQLIQMDDFAKHILTGSTNFAPGEMGKRDMIIVEAIYKSIKEGGKTIPLNLGNMGIVSI